MIEMRDGTKLYTVVYAPNDNSETYPFLITRTPYSSGPYEKGKFRNFPEYLTNEKFIFVYQDVRGKYMSEGNFIDMRPYIPNKTGKEIDEASDTYDTIEWLINNIANNNGKAGIYGISYPGFYSAMALNESHPALKAVSPQAPIADWFIGDDMHHNGAFTLSLSYVFFSSFGVNRPEPTPSRNTRIVELTGDSYNYFLNIGSLKNVNDKYFFNSISFWNDFTKHGCYDEYWQSLNTLNHFNYVAPAVMTVGGWYDGEDLYGALNTYKTIEKKNPQTNNILVMGPWSHGGWARGDGSTFGDDKFNSNTSEYYQNNLELKFFQYYLKEKGDSNFPEASIFETGTNKWNNFSEWPPKNSELVDYYLCGNGKIIDSKAKSSINFTEYISDPQKPVPYTAKFHRTGTMYNKTYMNEDQRFASSRPDVISFESVKLTEQITLAGSIEVELYVSTSGTDSDWIVKVIDVYPDSLTEVYSEGTTMANYQMLVRAEIMRGKFRNSFEKPEPFTPNEVTKVKFSLNDVNHTFLKGHKIMVQIQSSWFPLFDRNPQTFCNIYNAEEKDFQKATQRVYHTSEYPSKVVFRVLDK
ncbi:MAG: CocE/NonD family hydrolase [Bacteroidetes bacterium]|nr:CocE/NonD family hydrolase [Bacteroidota bacterium]MBU1114078.1 CocE/NonD family hydrolase [Bacteroidota bacterium]MBU1798177.1 CocE/NonD family hydrolase [Bacteroidota bacterium]